MYLCHIDIFISVPYNEYILRNRKQADLPQNTYSKGWHKMAKRLTRSDVYRMMKEDYTKFYYPMSDDVKKLFPVITADVLEKMGLHLTTKHTGKMNGMQSISTSCKCNGHCVKRIAKAFGDLGIDVTDMKSARQAMKKYIENNPMSTDICICALCFSDSQQDFQETMQIPLFRNYDILNNGIIHSDWLPIVNALYFRGESFGDYASANACINVMNIARKNPAVNITTWTKNLVYFDKAVKAGNPKPDNFKIVFSSPFINKVARIPEKYAYLVNAVFTVFTETYATANNIMINCGARACLSCLRCYKGFDGTVKYINELLK